MGGGHNFFSLFYVSCNFKRIFFQKIDGHFLGHRKTLFSVQILFYRDFYDFFRFTRPSSFANAFPSFAMDLRETNWRPTYLSCLPLFVSLTCFTLERGAAIEHGKPTSWIESCTYIQYSSRSTHSTIFSVSPLLFSLLGSQQPPLNHSPEHDNV